MKLISLNIWGGTLFEPLIAFVKEHEHDTDMFCFQEVFDTPTDRTQADKGARADSYRQLQYTLPNHRGFFSSAQDHYEYGHKEHGPSTFEISYGLACFVKNNLPLEEYREFFVFKNKNEIMSNPERNVPRNAQAVTIRFPEKRTTIFNFHGLWHPQNSKDDYPDRLEQSHKLRAAVDAQAGETIICGDFNLNHTTESLKILEEGMRNLITEYGITSTRSQLYKKENRFADYMLVSPGITVEDFSVPDITISDHLPMILTFS